MTDRFKFKDLANVTKRLLKPVETQALLTQLHSQHICWGYMQIETKHKSQEGGHVTLDGSFSNLESGESVGDGIKMREKMLRVENFDEHD